MGTANDAERIARARVIVSYRVPGRDNAKMREKLLKAAGITRGTYKNWMTLDRPGAPSTDDLIALAAAAGVPRRFAERGFDDLWEDNERPASRPPTQAAAAGVPDLPDETGRRSQAVRSTSAGHEPLDNPAAADSHGADER